MRRYAPIFLLSLCLVMVAFVGSLLLSGHADEKTEEFLPELMIYTTLPAETVQSLLTEEAQKQGLKLQVRSFSTSADLLKQLQQEQHFAKTRNFFVKRERKRRNSGAMPRLSDKVWRKKICFGAKCEQCSSSVKERRSTSCYVFAS